MRVTARLAIESPRLDRGGPYHGRNIVIRELSTSGFAAECGFPCPPGAIVRLRLPYVGTALARVIESEDGRLSADFLNPISQARLAGTLGGQIGMAQPAMA
jgi:hypothetical protein